MYLRALADKVANDEQAKKKLLITILLSFSSSFARCLEGEKASHTHINLSSFVFIY